MTQDLRTWTNINADGEKETIVVEADWDLVRGARLNYLQMTDTLMGSQWDRLTEEQQTELKTLRQHWRDIPTLYDTPNEACDNLQNMPTWVTLLFM